MIALVWGTHKSHVCVCAPSRIQFCVSVTTSLIVMNCLSYGIKLSELLFDNDNLQLIRLVLQSYLVFVYFYFFVTTIKVQLLQNCSR
jgi:hypothetical protein